ncbi:MAG: nucleotidyltransferase [Pseudomonadota bacterium]
MGTCRDYEEMFSILNAYKIRYLVVGAHAVICYTVPRYTKDMDIWIIPDMNDEEKVYAALKEFGAPLAGMTPADFAKKDIILQIGVAPVRIDIMMNVPGISFRTAWKNRRRTVYGRTHINVLGISELIAAKKMAGRPQDGIDLKKLNKHSKNQRKKA